MSQKERDTKRYGGPLFGPGHIDLSPLTVPQGEIVDVLSQIFSEPRYMVVTEYHDEEERRRRDVHLHGGNHPTLFRTLRNAVRTAVEGPAYLRSLSSDRERWDQAAHGVAQRGLVLQFDPCTLPVVDLNNPHPIIFKEDDELSFAERQFEWWGKRVVELTASHKVNKETRKP